jgi:hypothetical protein
MNQEAIEKLRQFQIKNHLSGYNLEQPEEQADIVSQSHSVQSGKVNPSRVPKKINYPDHVKPLKDRIMSALNNGARTPDAVANYCGEEIKLVTLQLGRWVSRGLIGRHTNPQSGITRYYPHDIAKEKGYLIEPQPINRKKGKKVKFVKPRSLDIADKALASRQLDLFNETASNLATAEQLMQHEALKKHCTFLENQVRGWQAESRKQAHEIKHLQVQLKDAHKTRDVTSEVTEVMQEVTQLRATIAYLESKLFGSK